MENGYDVLVIGGGHAGVEACLAAHRLGQRVILVTSRLDRISFMSCNPAIGGLAKGHMVREIDILGGEMGAVADQSCIQFKRLNARKGPAVRGSRAQCDKDLYSQKMGMVLKSTPGLELFEANVASLLLNKSKVEGVMLDDGSRIYSKTVIITTGTFMNGVMHTGEKQEKGGRVGEAATVGISDQLKTAGFSVKRLKTGTPARLDANSIDWSKTEEQEGDKVFYPFSYRSSKQLQLPQIKCYLTYTNEQTHEIIRKNLHRSPIYGGDVEGIGPRYCPSIEDKVVRFEDRNRHQTFLEPEGLKTNSIYLQGISTSLPIDAQESFLKTIPGLENVKVLRFGYAVEYDFIEPTQIWHTLETRQIENLFLAGQVNGTSGYEEAAAQGLIAGTNAARKCLDKSEFILSRDEAYMGVLVDDLVLKGTKEPYRMFTSRAEYRLNLREDNTLERLLAKAKEFGLVKNTGDLESVLKKRQETVKLLSTTKLTPKPEVQKRLEGLGTPVLQKPITYADLLRRTEISYYDLLSFGLDLSQEDEVAEGVEVAVKYEGYIRRQSELIEQARKLEGMKLRRGFPYEEVRGLSHEEVEKLQEIQPETLGQASRISGVNPSAIQALVVYQKGQERRQNREAQQL